VTDPANPRLHAEAIKAALEAAGLDVGRGQRPPVAVDDQGLPIEGCVVLHISTGSPHGSLGDRNGALTVTFVVQAFGGGPEQAEQTAHLARVALLGSPPQVAGRRSHPVAQQAAPPAASRDDSVSPPLWAMPTVYQLTTWPE
jgi:hypothetical protein